MATYLHLTWPASPGVGFSRRDRHACEYRAYLPDPLMGRPIRLDGEVAADVADAEAGIGRLNGAAAAPVDSEALARLLLRAEAVASSRIEGLEVGARRLLRAEAAQALGDEARDVTAEEVLANINAVRWAIQSVAEAPELTTGHLLEMHRLLLAGTRLSESAGRLRDEQNWIGGSGYNPCSAAFVPPPPDAVEPLLEDLCRFCSGDALSPVVQAALAHAQFETIHPFVDGNGRIGRALIQVVLRRRGLASRVLPPVSLVLATQARQYVAGLMATRYDGDPSSQAAHEGLNQWIAVFASACRRAVSDAFDYEARAKELEDEWRSRLGSVRRGSAADLLLGVLPGAPIVTAGGAAELTGRTYQAANQAVARLTAAGILRPVRVGRRNRAFEAPEVIDAFTGLERALAMPAESPARRGS
jgi:Fic family protein